MFTRYLAMVVVLLGIFFAPFVQTKTPIDPTLVRFVNDYANIISPEVQTQLESELNAYTLQTDHTIVVATVSSLEGEREQQFANKLFAKWKIGRADIDNGLLILVAPNERKVWIEVGYGLEGVVTDAFASHIARTIMAPAFKSGDYDKGILEGVAAIQKAGREEMVLGKKEEKALSRMYFFIPLFLFSPISIIGGALFIAFNIDDRKRIRRSIIAGTVAGLLYGFITTISGGSLVYTVLIAAIHIPLAYLLARRLNTIQFDPTKYKISHKGDAGGGGGGSGGGFSGNSGGSSGGGGGGGSW